LPWHCIRELRTSKVGNKVGSDKHIEKKEDNFYND